MKVIKNDKIVMCDVDSTLLEYNLSSYPNEDRVHLNLTNDKTFEMIAVPNKKNINLLIKLAKLGYSIILWSRSGSLWAEEAGKKLDIDKYITLYLTKPLYYIDDQQSQDFMGTRLWRDPVTGVESSS